jgi:hypothetical protein
MRVGTPYISYGLIPQKTRLAEASLTKGPGRASLGGAAVGHLAWI